MNLLIHDLACAIERDATDPADDRSNRDRHGRADWVAEWRIRFEHEPVEPRRRLQLTGE